jgi:eukaryotic-like serine/threonine-protein kinase
MIDERQVELLLDEILNSERTPEEVCGRCPELLGEVSRRWQQIRLVDAELEALFPKTVQGLEPIAQEFSDEGVSLPRVPGYKVVAVCARGGMGIVFQARHLKLNRIVALKMLLAGAYAAPLELARFRREAQAVAALRHPHIVQVYDVGDLNGHPYFTMEFVEGGSLAQQVCNNRPSVRQAAELVATVASAVQFAHKSGIIHRDLKPANILLTADGTPKITDFGLARIQGGTEFTLSGARLGTPSYMAPEQALGKTSALGPAVDVYSLGAVLYELLTGQPPFQGATASDIERQVVAEEAKPPSWLNANVPRNLDTICLKCLSKNPARRYASAQDLAQDLHRYLDGLPVLARPVGVLERGVKWVRRRPALAALILMMLVTLAAAVGTSIWLQWQRSSRQAFAQHIIEDGIPGAYELAGREQWQDAKKHLDNIRSHLPYADSDELNRRVARAQQDINFAERLEQIRESHSYSVPESNALWEMAKQDWGKEYAEAFAQAHLDIDDVETAAATIRASEIQGPIVTALDLWALAAFHEKNDSLQAHLLKIARLADPDPFWRDRFRDPAAWNDSHKLVQLADDAAKVPTPPAAHQLAIVSLCMYNADPSSDGLSLIQKAQRSRPRDRWLTWELGVVLERLGKHRDAASYFRIVQAQRPENPWILDHLSLALTNCRENQDAIELSRLAVEREPNNAVLRQHFAVILLHDQQFDEAREQCQLILQTNPNNASAIFLIAASFSLNKQPSKSLPYYRRAIEIDPHYLIAYYYLGLDLLELRRFDEAEAVFRQLIDLNPMYWPGHLGLSRTALLLGKHDLSVAERKVLIDAMGSRLKVKQFEVAFDITACFAEVYEGLAVSQCWLGREAEARAAAQRLGAAAQPVSSIKNVWQKLERIRTLRPIEARLPAILAEKEMPADFTTQLAVAEWAYEDKNRTYFAARLFAAAFAGQPDLAEALDAHNRFEAACAATQAGCGFGEDAGQLDETTKASLRKQALAWLTAERVGWANRCQKATKEQQDRIAQTLSLWLRCPDLACVHTPEGLEKLPTAESIAWQQFWDDVKYHTVNDSEAPLAQARWLATRKDWGRAMRSYAVYFSKARTINGEAWFEYAAVQLLTGDDKAYRQTCQTMLEKLKLSSSEIRGYHAARACTLAPDSAENVIRAERASSAELMRYHKDFWSLTEQGALHYRAGRYREAVAALRQSLQAENRQGVAVLNWLWLAMSYHQLGEKEEAQRWLDKATEWLDKMGKEMPANAEILNLHLHNWMEAHILRREAEKLFAASAKK